MAEEDLLSPAFVQPADTLIEVLQPPIEFLHQIATPYLFRWPY